MYLPLHRPLSHKRYYKNLEQEVIEECRAEHKEQLIIKTKISSYEEFIQGWMEKHIGKQKLDYERKLEARKEQMYMFIINNTINTATSDVLDRWKCKGKIIMITDLPKKQMYIKEFEL